MFPRWVKLCTLVLATLCVAACASTAPTPRVVYITTTPVPQTPTKRVVFVTATPSTPGAIETVPPATALPLPTLLPSVTPLAPTDTPLPVTPTPVTRTVVARAPTRTAVKTAIPPGVYVDALQVEPARPIRGTPVTFIATFVNTTGAPQPLKWLVLIYRPNPRNPFGDTSPQSITIPTGTTQLSSANNWRISLKGDCESFYAQVNWQDIEKERAPFTATDGHIVSLNFEVCPP